MSKDNYLRGIIKRAQISTDVTLFDISSFTLKHTVVSPQRCVCCPVSYVLPPSPSASASSVGLKEFARLSVGEGRKWELAVWLCQAFPRFLICTLIALQYGCTVCMCALRVCGTAQHGIACHVSSAFVFHAASITYIQLSIAWHLKIKQQTYRFSVIEVLSCFWNAFPLFCMFCHLWDGGLECVALY